MERQVSPNFDERPDGTTIDMLVLHYTGMQTAKAAVERLCDAEARVSAHYLIHEDGRVLQMVEENSRAWHAGAAWWRGNSDINGRSIGIELVNPGHEFGLRSFPEKQMKALVELALDILHRYSIPARNVVGHSDVAPRRKYDPGEMFDWLGLSRLGIGIWPEGAAPHEMEVKKATILLKTFGYETIDMDKTLQAFQRHYRPSKIDGELDPETAGLLDRLSASVG